MISDMLLAYNRKVEEENPMMTDGILVYEIIFEDRLRLLIFVLGKEHARTSIHVHLHPL